MLVGGSGSTLVVACNPGGATSPISSIPFQSAILLSVSGIVWKQDTQESRKQKWWYVRKSKFRLEPTSYRCLYHPVYPHENSTQMLNLLFLDCIQMMSYFFPMRFSVFPKNPHELNPPANCICRTVPIRHRSRDAPNRNESSSAAARKIQVFASQCWLILVVLEWYRNWELGKMSRKPKPSMVGVIPNISRRSLFSSNHVKASRYFDSLDMDLS